MSVDDLARIMRDFEDRLAPYDDVLALGTIIGRLERERTKFHLSHYPRMGRPEMRFELVIEGWGSFWGRTASHAATAALLALDERKAA